MEEKRRRAIDRFEEQTEVSKQAWQEQKLKDEVASQQKRLAAVEERAKRLGVRSRGVGHRLGTE